MYSFVELHNFKGFKVFDLANDLQLWNNRRHVSLRRANEIFLHVINSSQYSLATRLILIALINSGDIETHPGPSPQQQCTKRKYVFKVLCTVCSKGVRKRPVICICCGSSTHSSCIKNLSNDLYDNHSKEIIHKCLFCINTKNKPHANEEIPSDTDLQRGISSSEVRRSNTFVTNATNISEERNDNNATNKTVQINNAIPLTVGGDRINATNTMGKSRCNTTHIFANNATMNSHINATTSTVGRDHNNAKNIVGKSCNNVTNITMGNDHISAASTMVKNQNMDISRTVENEHINDINTVGKHNNNATSLTVGLGNINTTNILRGCDSST